MKNTVHVIFIILLFSLLINNVQADCTDEEINSLKKDVEKVKVTYKHLGEVEKEDGTKVYDQFIVSTYNIPENVYIYLYPTTTEKFEDDSDDSLKIKLTTGKWSFDFYSSKCDMIIDSIKVKLPTFNIYSLDPLCEGIDGNEFKLCGKYYEGTVSRKNFEERIKLYRQLHVKEEQVDEVSDNVSIINNIIDFISKYYLYMLVPVIFILIGIVIFKIISKRNNKKILQ